MALSSTRLRTPERLGPQRCPPGATFTLTGSEWMEFVLRLAKNDGCAGGDYALGCASNIRSYFYSDQGGCTPEWWRAGVHDNAWRMNSKTPKRMLRAHIDEVCCLASLNWDENGPSAGVVLNLLNPSFEAATETLTSARIVGYRGLHLSFKVPPGASEEDFFSTNAAAADALFALCRSLRWAPTFTCVSADRHECVAVWLFRNPVTNHAQHATVERANERIAEKFNPSDPESAASTVSLPLPGITAFDATGAEIGTSYVAIPPARNGEWKLFDPSPKGRRELLAGILSVSTARLSPGHRYAREDQARRLRNKLRAPCRRRMRWSYR